MTFYFNVSWKYFCIALGAMLVVYFIMHLLSKKFYTQHVFVRKFSILDIEFPATALELATFINGIFLLPPDLSHRSLRALRMHLYLNFLFMMLVSLSVFLFCMHVSMKMDAFWHFLFALIAWLQIIPLVSGTISTIYLLNNIQPEFKVSKPNIYKRYQISQTLKWGVGLISMTSAVSVVFYFFLTGKYSTISLNYLIIILIEVTVIFSLFPVFKYKRMEEQEYAAIEN